MHVTLVRQRGLGLVELMVGITVGLIVAAAASIVAVKQIDEHRRLMLEMQVQQDLRTAADLLQQDLRRAGFRGRAEFGVWSPPVAVGTTSEQAANTATANAFTDVTVDDDDESRALTYQYARSTSGSAVFSSTGALRDVEHFGFKWDKRKKELSLLVGIVGGSANWQPITDAGSVEITDFSVSIDEQSVDVGDFCDKPCNPPTAGADACPKHVVREVKFTIVGQATHDKRNVRRTLTGSERLRADQIIGACPA